MMIIINIKKKYIESMDYCNGNYNDSTKVRQQKNAELLRILKFMKKEKKRMEKECKMKLRKL